VRDPLCPGEQAAGVGEDLEHVRAVGVGATAEGAVENPAEHHAGERAARDGKECILVGLSQPTKPKM
jgi:hypothetical protein